MTRFCRVPDCNAEIYRGNKSGVCREHNHAAHWCGCSRCEPHTGFRPSAYKRRLVEPDAPPQPPARVADRPGVKVVEVTDGQTCSGLLLVTRVSLPAAPWEMGA